MDSFDKRRTLVKFLCENGHKKVQTLRKVTGFPSTTLYRCVAGLEQTDEIKIIKSPGHPEYLSSTQKKKLENLVKKERSVTSKEAAAALNSTYPSLNIAS
ncbi:10296_t:CDS:1 [Racocetra fulgida]|uniref:10296_t:CDS:1 n=1 Tax=Racocetra fulgida TaxID=60492 RepID=A0A9N9AXA9_9GLOM|nr:10296_t:CDS:1 [Racocetra fulgida]